MGGRNDFGILRSSFHADDRAQRAAELYQERFGVPEAFAFAAVAGHVASLGIWAMRETDDGILPGDGVSPAQDALHVPRGITREIVKALTDAGLLRAEPSGLYLVGFRDCYGSILESREVNAENKRLARAEAKEARRKRLERIAKKDAGKDVPVTSDGRPSDVQVTSEGHPKDVTGTSGLTVPYRTEPFRTVPGRTEPPVSAHDGVGSASPPDDDGPLTAADKAQVRAMAEVLANGKHTAAQKRTAALALAELANGTINPRTARLYIRQNLADTSARVAGLAARKAVTP